MGYFYHNEVYDNLGKRKRILRRKIKKQREGERARKGKSEEESKGIEK